MIPLRRSFKITLAVSLIALVLPMAFPPCLSAATRGIRVVSEKGQSVFLYEEYHAIVIGVGNYTVWPKLPNAVRDAREVASRLKTMGFRVNLIVDPTSRELKTALNEMVYRTGSQKDRAILLYYAGHGETETLADGTKMGYMIPKDCPLLKRDPVQFAAHAISMRYIESASLKIRSRHVIMLFDSCFSGSLFALVRAVPEDITEKSRLPVRQYITAGGEDEQVPDRSMFKRSFLVGLEGDADLTGDGYITGSELGMYLSDKVVNYTHRRQHPQYGKINNPELDRGDFIFVRPNVGQRPKFKDPENDLPLPKSSPKPKTEDTRLEILFWESIKDSDHPEMFEEYLKHFPNGTFTGLANLKLKNLKPDDSNPPKGSAAPAADDQAAVSPTPATLSPPGSPIKLAIFPMKQEVPKPYDRFYISQLGAKLDEIGSVEPMYSYYNLGPKANAQKISSKILGPRELDKMWIQSYFSRAKPNVDVICQIGRKLGVDAVLTYNMRLRVGTEDNFITAFVVDVATKDFYAQRSRYVTYWLDSTPLEKTFDAVTEGVFSQYKEGRNRQRP